MAKKKNSEISEITIEDDSEIVEVSKPLKGAEKAMDKARKSLAKINDMQIEVVQDYTNLKTLKSFRSGATPLDVIMGFEGYPYGKFIEMFGKESCGKTTLAMQAVNSCVNGYGGYALIMDIENKAWNWPVRNIELGFDVKDADRVILAQPSSCEDAMNAAYAFVNSLVVEGKIRDTPILIVWDSIAASTSDKERENDTGNIGYLDQSRIINQGHRRLIGLINEYNIENVTFLWLNQARESQGNRSSFMPAEIVTFGGKAPSFYSSIRIMLKKTKSISTQRKGQKLQVGQIINAKTEKNKLKFARQSTDIYIMYGSGIDDAFTSYEWLKVQGLLKAVKADENGHDEELCLLSGEKLRFSKRNGFRSIFSKHHQEIQAMMKAHYDELLSSCSKDFMKSEDVTVESDTPEEE